MKNTKRDLLRLHNTISQIEGQKFSSVKFNYFIAKNKVLMKDEIAALEEASKPNEEFKEFDTERAKIAQKYADKNEDGTAKIQQNSFVISVNIDVFQKDMTSLREKYSKTLEKRDKQIKEFETILDEEVDFKGSKINFKDIPADLEPVVLESFIITNLIIEEE